MAFRPADLLSVGHHQEQITRRMGIFLGTLCACGRFVYRALPWSFAVLAIIPAPAATAHQYVMLDYNLTLSPRTRDTAFIEVFDDKPLTQANFMEYVNGGRYDGSFMHRLARVETATDVWSPFVIQGGGFYPVFQQEPSPVLISLDPTKTVDRDGNPGTSNPTVTNEYSVGTVRSNVTGTIAMARVGGQPNSATNQWFVNYKNNSFLDSVDGGFTVFAQVKGDGMSLFNAFGTLPITNLNPDTNDNGTRDGGPFFNYSASPDNFGNPTDGVPFLSGSSGDFLVVVEKAKRIDYLGAGLTTNVPAGGLTFSTRDVYIDTGTQFVFEGTGGLTIGAGRTVGIREQTHIARSIINHGTLQPGLALGMIRLQSFRQEATGTLDIQIGGEAKEEFGVALPTPAPQQPYTAIHIPYDRLEVTSGALLGGTLNVTLLNGFVPTVNDTFNIISAGVISDRFTTINLPQLTAGLVWNISQSATAFTITASAGDYNRDGVVDVGDYVLWRKTRNTSVSTAYSGADGDGNMMINDADLLIWERNLGNKRGGTFGGGGSTVPEPASATIVLIGVCAALGRRGRRP